MTATDSSHLEPDTHTSAAAPRGARETLLVTFRIGPRHQATAAGREGRRFGPRSPQPPKTSLGQRASPREPG